MRGKQQLGLDLSIMADRHKTEDQVKVERILMAEMLENPRPAPDTRERDQLIREQMAAQSRRNDDELKKPPISFAVQSRMAAAAQRRKR